LLTIQDCMFEGVCIIRFEGRVSLGEGSQYFRQYFQQKIEDGSRLFVLDCQGLLSVDSSGMGEVWSLITRVRMRAGRLVFINLKNIEPLFKITHTFVAIEVAPDLPSAIELIVGRPVKVPAKLKFEDQYSVSMKGKPGAQKLVVEDSTVEPPKKEEYPVREIPAPLPPERLSIMGMAGVAFASLVIVGLLIVGLVWVTKQVSSVPLLVLIFCVALLFSMCLLGLVLLLSGHLSEKTVAKLFTGVLGKIPGLGTWIPKVAAKRTKI
jgi:anti-anti-sigma regulatory factor